VEEKDPLAALPPEDVPSCAPSREDRLVDRWLNLTATWILDTVVKAVFILFWWWFFGAVVRLWRA
jgi:hypothetical protein